MNDININILRAAVDIYREINAKAIIICGDLLPDCENLDELLSDVSVIFVTQGKKVPPEKINGCKVIDLPLVTLSRLGLIKVSVMMSISDGYLSSSDKVVCISGSKRMNYLDTLIVIDLEKESEIIVSKDSCNISNEVKPEVFSRVLALSVELAKQGRENDPVGTIFVMGDHKNVLNQSRQLIINPFHGYPDHEKQILNPNLMETIKEFSTIDGAFVIRGDGVVLSAGRHLNTSLDAEELTPGLGCRHAAAAGITATTKSVAIVISQSTGCIRIFKDGKVIMKIEKTIAS